MNAWLLLKGLETLELRVQRQCESARALADFLAGRDKLSDVLYPGSLSHPQADLAARQMTAGGSLVGFTVAGSKDGAFRFLNALRLLKLAVSLGGTESLIEHPATMTHSDIPADRQMAMGITPGMMRLSVGVEHPDDIIADLTQALSAA